MNYKKLLLTTAVAMNFVIAADCTKTPDADKPTTTTFSGNFKTETKKGDETTSIVDVKLSGDYTKTSATTAWNFLLDLVTTGNDAVEIHVNAKGTHKTDPSELAGSVTFKDGVDLDVNILDALRAFNGIADKVTLMDALSVLGMTKITTSSSHSSRVIDADQNVKHLIQGLISADMPITIRDILTQLGLTAKNAPAAAATPTTVKEQEEDDSLARKKSRTENN